MAPDTEHELAQLDITRHTLKDACRVLGTPSHRQTYDVPNVDGRGPFTLAHFEWSLGDASVAVVARVPMNTGEPEDLFGVRVTGGGSGHSTGAGLRTGHSLQDAVDRYGPPTAPEPPSYRFIDGASLVLTLEEGRISEIQLLSPPFAGMFQEE